MPSTNGYQRKWEPRRSGRSVADETRNSYYGMPVVKAPHWDWKIVLYFFLGGITSAAHVIASFAALRGGRTNQQIERVGRYLSLAALIPSPILLIMDLGRPERFHHMLRVIKLRSPMSVGTWGLTAFGLFSGLAGVTQMARDGLLNWFPPVKKLLLLIPTMPLNIVGSIFGFFVGGYTGVLLAITAIPVWAKNYLLLGPLFLSSALSNATAAMTLIFALGRGNHKVLRRLERLDLVVLAAESSLLAAAWVNLGAVLRRPLSQGSLKPLFRWGVIGTGIVAPIVIQTRTLISGKTSRPLAVISALCTLVGGYCLRHVMVYAGHASAADPQATFEFTRGENQPELNHEDTEDTEIEQSIS